MIVCSCNLLTDGAIREALRRPGAPERVRDVYAKLGCAAKCGGCAGSIARLLTEAEREREQAEAPSQRRDAA